MFSIVKKNIFITNNSLKNLRLYSKPIKKLNSRYFFYNWNQHAEYRSSFNLTKTYLLIKKTWYFQKKKNLLNLKKFKNINSFTINILQYQKINSKLIDFIKKIF